MNRKIIKKTELLILASVAAMCVSQFGMFIVTRMSSVYRSVTVKSCVLILFTAIFVMCVLAVLWLLYGKKGTVPYVLSALFAITAVSSFFSPTAEEFYRYPSLAVILAVELPLTVLILGKREGENRERQCCGWIEKLFVISALILGLIVCYFTPFGSYNCWDDENHYMEVIDTSEGIYPAYSEADIRLIYDKEQPQNFEKRALYKEQLQAIENDNGYIIENPRAILPNKIGQMGAVLAHWLGRTLNINFYWKYLFGRAGNLLIYVFVMYCAISRLKHGKTLMFTLAMTPTMLNMSGNYAYDPWVFSFMSLGFAYFFSIIEEDRKITFRDTVIMLGATILAVLPKTPYAFMFIFFLFMPQNKFNTKRERNIYYAVIIAIGIAMFAYTYALSFAVEEDPADNRNENGVVSSIGQIAFILSNPKEFITILVSFLKDYLSPKTFISMHATFGYMGELRVLSYIYSAVIVLAAIIDAPNSKIITRIGGIVIYVAMAGVLAAILYLIFTPVAQKTIDGCQVRYLYPSLFLILTSIFGGWLKRDIKAANICLAATATIVCTVSIAKMLVIPYFGG